MKKAFLAVSMLVSAALLLAVSCRDDSGVSGKNEHGANIQTDNPDDSGGGTEPNITPVSNAKINTLCAYAQRKGHAGTRIFQDNAHLTSFLDSTGYNENDSFMTIKKMERQPDFKTHIYFAIAGLLDWRSPPKMDISEGQDTVTIIYTRLVPPEPIDGQCPEYAPPPEYVHAYFIPFTEKTVTISDTLERFKCACGRH